jgi:nitrogen fixation protein NifQ
MARAAAAAREVIELRGQVLRPWTAPAGLAHWPALMDHAVDADSPLVLALAGVIAQAWERHGLDWLPLPGLDAHATRRLLMRWFPAVDRDLGLDWTLLAGRERSEPRFDEIEEIVGLLTEHACSPMQASWDEVNGLAHAIGLASLDENHLWQDLQLPSRAQLSALMSHWFPRLAEKNSADMKWKRFLYKQLCDRAEVQACRAPSCGVCSDYAHCFGPEDAPQLMAA